MICRCGRTMDRESLNGLSYWLCPSCDTLLRCRNCQEAFVEGEEQVPAPSRIGLVHLHCPSDELHELRTSYARLSGAYDALLCEATVARRALHVVLRCHADCVACQRAGVAALLAVDG